MLHSNLKPMKLFDCELIGVCVVIMLNTVCCIFQQDISNEYLYHKLSSR